MIMQEAKDKQAIRNLLNCDDMPKLDQKFENRLLNRLLALANTNNNVFSIQTKTKTLKWTSLPRWWIFAIACSLVIGIGYWKNQHELEEMRQFDVVLEFSMGTL